MTYMFYSRLIGLVFKKVVLCGIRPGIGNIIMLLKKADISIHSEKKRKIINDTRKRKLPIIIIWVIAEWTLELHEHMTLRDVTTRLSTLHLFLDARHFRGA